MNTLIGTPLKRGKGSDSNDSGTVTSVANESIFLNNSGSLPPVDCPLLIQVGDVLMPAVRTGIIPKKSASMEYRLKNGNLIHSRYRWTYP